MGCRSEVAGTLTEASRRMSGKRGPRPGVGLVAREMSWSAWMKDLYRVLLCFDVVEFW